MPSEMSTESLRQSEHSAPAAKVPSIGTPQLQHKILDRFELKFPGTDLGRTHVALSRGTRGLDGKETGASRSIDILLK